MPSFVHGKGSVFHIADSGAVDRDISNALDDVTFPEEAETADVTAFGNNSRAYIVGLKNSTISGKGMFDATTDGYFNGLLGLSGGSAFIYGPAGGSAGKTKYTGTALLTKYEIGSPVGDKVAVSFEFQITGDVTRTTF